MRDWAARPQPKPDKSAERLAGLLKDPRASPSPSASSTASCAPRTCGVGARNLERLSRDVPRFLPWYLRSASPSAAASASLAPWLIIPIAKRALRAAWSAHLVVDATPEAARQDARASSAQTAPGSTSTCSARRSWARREARRVASTARRRCSSATTSTTSRSRSRRSRSQLSMWAFDETVERRRRAAAAALRARRAAEPAEVHQPRHGGVPRPRPDDRGLRAAARRSRELQRPRGRHRAAGLPARRARRAAAAHRVGDRARVAAGGAGDQGARRQGREPRDGARRRERARLAARAPAEQAGDRHELQARARLGAHARERRRACASASPATTCSTSPSPGCSPRARGVASRRRVRDAARHGHRRRRDAVRERRRRRCCSTRRSCTPASSTPPITYLVRRLEENASERELHVGRVRPRRRRATCSTRERDRFLALARAHLRRRGGRRRPNRTAEPAAATSPCRAAPRTRSRTSPTPTRRSRRTAPGAAHDPRARGRVDARRRARSRAAASRTTPTLERRIAERRRGRRRLGRRSAPSARRAPARRRPTRSRRVRGRAIEVMAAETGKTIAEADAEVQRGDRLRPLLRRAARASSSSVDGARFVPVGAHRRHAAVELPGRDPAGGVLAALAAGSGVIIKPAPQARRSRRRHGRGALGGGRPARRAACSSTSTRARSASSSSPHPAVDRVILTGCVRDRRAVPLVAPRPAAAGRDERQERHHRHADAPTSTSPSPTS